MTLLPPLNGLRAFDAAGRCLSFRAAADELGVTQGAVAQQVRQLEAHLGVTLFDRLPKGLALTITGRSYHVQVADAFADLRAATARLKPEPGKVLISVTPTFAAKWLIPNLPDFASKHPDIDLRILATEKLSSFHSDGIDLAIRQGEPPFGAAINATRLFRQDLIAVAAPSLVGTQKLPLSLDVLSGLPKIHDTHNLWPKFCATLGMTDTSGRRLQLSQTSLSMDAALSGQGAALVSRFLVARDIAAGKLVDVAGQSTLGPQDFYLLSERKIKATTAAVAVMAWLVAQSDALEA